jgi:aspartyl-tRNA(Asn)/glutamyl-tRNA(Gln) amidotransferase subunit C
VKLTSNQVKKVAKLANLPLSNTDEEKYASQLSNILEYIELLNSIETTNIEPTYNVSGQVNIFAKDEAGDSTLTQEESLKNASNSRDGFFVTKGVFSEE